MLAFRRGLTLVSGRTAFGDATESDAKSDSRRFYECKQIKYKDMEPMKTIFNDYIKGCPNSFDANFEVFDHNEPLFPHHVLVNSKTQLLVNDCLIFGSKQGFFLKNDRIICNVPEA
jgi:hypothetical protein